MKIAGKKVGGANKPYIVAEISGNHCGNLLYAKNLIKMAKWAGADAVKTQCYEPDTITLNCSTPDFIMQDGLWRGKKLYDLYSKAYTPFAWHEELYKYARNEIDITIFSSVFDKTSVDLLESLEAPAYKIASFEIIDTPLIEYVNQTNKPLIISTGMATNGEILDADLASEGSAAFLFCTSEYPAELESANLGGIYELQALLPTNVIGLSDHSVGREIPMLATSMGVNIIEKHLKLAGVSASEDDEFSVDEFVFRSMVEMVEKTFKACQYKPPGKNPSRQARRSLYVVEDIKMGEIFTEDNVRSIRPGYGLPPKDLPKVLGKKAKKNFRKGERLTWKF